MTDQEMQDQIRQLENRVAVLALENSQLKDNMTKMVEQLRKDLKLLQSDLERKTNQFYFKP